MKTVVMYHYRDTSVLRHEETSKPELESEAILVRISHAGVSPFDIHMREGKFKIHPGYQLPMIVGWELSGEVAAVGAHVTQFKPGDAVFAHSSIFHNGGAYVIGTASEKNEEAAAAQALLATGHVGGKILLAVNE